MRGSGGGDISAAPDPSPLPLPTGEGVGAARFIDSAARLAGLAGALLGWRPDEFWKATPAELAAVLAALSPEVEAGLSRDELERLRGLFPD